MTDDKFKLTILTENDKTPEDEQHLKRAAAKRLRKLERNKKLVHAGPVSA